MTVPIDVCILDPRLCDQPRGPTPRYQTSGSAGMDLQASLTDDVVIRPGSVMEIPAGISIHIQDSAYAGLIVPRSGLGGVDGGVLANLVGVIDSDYTGEIKVRLWNRNDPGVTPYKNIVIKPLQRIAQLLIVPVARCAWNVVDSHRETSRGSGGFGHTGND